MKLAYFGFPHTGGTYAVYEALRTGLKPCGINLTWLGLGPKASAALRDPGWAGANLHGKVIANEIDDERYQARALIEYLEASDLSGVFVNVLANRTQINAIRYLDKRLIRIMIVHNITLGTYAAARAVRDHVDATVAVSERTRSDLVEKYGFSASRTHAIPNGIDTERFVTHRQVTRGAAPLRLLFLGRIIDSDKGVLLLPKLLTQLSDVPLTLTVAGDGPDMDGLRRRCQTHGERVHFTGKVPAGDVIKVLAEHDVLVFPSRFEGLPLSLIEARAAGCVPVASRIKGVTDFVINDRVDGILFPIDRVREAAAAIRTLAQDRELLFAMSKRGCADAYQRFGLVRMCNAYADVIEQSMQARHALAPKLEINDWSYPSGLRPGLRTYFPKSVKDYLRAARERHLGR